MPKFLEELETEAKKQPWYVWAGAATGLAVVGYMLIKSRLAASSAASSAPASSADTLNGYDIAAMEGIPYGYNNYNGPVDNYPPTPTPTPTPTPLPKLTTRAKTPVDPSNSKRTGVPLFQAIGSFGHSVAEIPFGTQVTATGPAVQGISNRGNTTWYPVTYNGKTGFLSGFDIAHVGGNAGGGEFYHEVNAGRASVFHSGLADIDNGLLEV